MGWFSKDIMGGDEPMDCQQFILNFCGLKSDKTTIKSLKKKTLEEKQTVICEKISLKRGKEKNIGLQVLAVLLMNKGVKILPAVFDIVRKAIKNDSWAKEDPERKIMMWYALKQLDAYVSKNPKPTSEYPPVKRDYTKGIQKEYVSTAIDILKQYYMNHKYVKQIISCVITSNQYGICIIASDEFDNWSKKTPKSFLSIPVVLIAKEDIEN